MPELTLEELSAISGRQYIDEVKSRLRSDTQWLVMLNPAIVEHTRWALNRIMKSIDEQRERVGSDGNAEWFRSTTALHKLCQRRLFAMAPPAASRNRETRDWKEFSARLAYLVDGADSKALDNVKVPYGNITAREWLEARNEKRRKA